MAEIQIKIIVPGSEATVQTGSEGAAGPPPETLERIEAGRESGDFGPEPVMLEGDSGFDSAAPPAPEPLDDDAESSGKKAKSGKSKK